MDKYYTIENASNVFEFHAPMIDMTDKVWCLRFRKCGLWANDFWESRIETAAYHWSHE